MTPYEKKLLFYFFKNNLGIPKNIPEQDREELINEKRQELKEVFQDEIEYYFLKPKKILEVKNKIFVMQDGLKIGLKETTIENLLFDLIIQHWSTNDLLRYKTQKYINQRRLKPDKKDIFCKVCNKEVLEKAKEVFKVWDKYYTCSYVCYENIKTWAVEIDLNTLEVTTLK